MKEKIKESRQTN